MEPETSSRQPKSEAVLVSGVIPAFDMVDVVLELGGNGKRVIDGDGKRRIDGDLKLERGCLSHQVVC